MTNGNDRVDTLEDAVMRLINVAQDHNTMLLNLQNIQQDQTGILRALTDNIEELRRDTQYTQRLWIRLAQKYGWLDDDDLA